MVCPICIVTPIIIIVGNYLGISPYIITTLIGGMIFALAKYTDIWLRNLSENKRGNRNSYIPFQFFIIFILYLAFVIASYYYMGLLDTTSILNNPGGVCNV